MLFDSLGLKYDQKVDEISSVVNNTSLAVNVTSVVTATTPAGLAFSAMGAAADAIGIGSSTAQSGNFNRGMGLLSSSASAYMTIAGGGATASVAGAGLLTVSGVVASGAGLGLAIGTGINYIPVGGGKNVMEWLADAIGEAAFGDIERMNKWEVEQAYHRTRIHKFSEEIRKMNDELERYNNMMGGSYDENSCN